MFESNVPISCAVVSYSGASDDDPLATLCPEWIWKTAEDPRAMIELRRTRREDPVLVSVPRSSSQPKDPTWLRILDLHGPVVIVAHHRTNSDGGRPTPRYEGQPWGARASRPKCCGGDAEVLLPYPDRRLHLRASRAALLTCEVHDQVIPGHTASVPKYTKAVRCDGARALHERWTFRSIQRRARHHAPWVGHRRAKGARMRKSIEADSIEDLGDRLGAADVIYVCSGDRAGESDSREVADDEADA